MEILVTILHVMVCIFLMLTVLLQAGKGGGMGAAFGGGSSMGTVFGGSGAGTFLRRLTVAAAVIFLFTSMILAWMATPSTDPLKEYWAEQQAAKEQRSRAHKEALKGAGDTRTESATPQSSAAGSQSAAESTPGESRPDDQPSTPAPTGTKSEEPASDKPPVQAAPHRPAPPTSPAPPANPPPPANPAPSSGSTP